ncbi:MAG: STAS domain-containing protein [Gammaproteobacteria bacterium]|nr:STAS domain-containing protein [Gammaproteobacteria bacterium]
MEIATERDGGTLFLTVSGRIDGLNAHEFQDSATGAIEDADGHVILDFENVSYISSAGLRAVLLIAKTVRERHAQFAVCSLTKLVDEVFRISGFDNIVPIHETRAAAVAAAQR